MIIPTPQIWLIEKENESYKIVVYDLKRVFVGLEALITVKKPPKVYCAKNSKEEPILSCLFKDEHLIRFRKNKNHYTILNYKRIKLFILDKNDFRYHVRERACLRVL
ncbi:MAG: hypothetical protein WC303_02655 [Candidatus Paceibacterota bacterium]|jgi:hypothetical protein